MIIIIFTLVLLWIAGMVISYTNIGDIPQFEADTEETTKIEQRKTKWALSLYSFNPFSNLLKILTVKEGGDKTLAVLNGVRVLSMGWVIVGHGFVFAPLGTVSNLATMSAIVENPTFGFVIGGIYAVDTFFWLSGFLTFYILTTKMYPKKGNIGGMNFFMFYFHRYYRLIFPLAFTQFFMMFLVIYLGSGPLYW